MRASQLAASAMTALMRIVQTTCAILPRSRRSSPSGPPSLWPAPHRRKGLRGRGRVKGRRSRSRSDAGGALDVVVTA